MDAVSVASLGGVPLLLYCCRCRLLRIKAYRPTLRLLRTQQ